MPLNPFGMPSGGDLVRRIPRVSLSQPLPMADVQVIQSEFRIFSRTLDPQLYGRIVSGASKRRHDGTIESVMVKLESRVSRVLPDTLWGIDDNPPDHQLRNRAVRVEELRVYDQQSLVVPLFEHEIQYFVVEVVPLQFAYMGTYWFLLTSKQRQALLKNA